MEFKKVSVYGFGRNGYVFMLPAIRHVLGKIKPGRILSLDELRENPPECDIMCMNCGMSFYDMELFFTVFADSYGERAKPTVLCLSWEGVPQENLDIMLANNAELILFDLRGEEEFSLCREVN